MWPTFPLLREALNFSFQALQANKVRTALTALGLLIGNASVILVVTISMTSRDLILDKIRGIGSNLVFAQYDGGPLDATRYDADFIKLGDVDAVRRDLGSRIIASTPVLTSNDRMKIEGKERDVRIIGSDEYYADVRNLQCAKTSHFGRRRCSWISRKRRTRSSLRRGKTKPCNVSRPRCACG